MFKSYVLNFIKYTLIKLEIGALCVPVPLTQLYFKLVFLYEKLIIDSTSKDSIKDKGIKVSVIN